MIASAAEPTGEGGLRTNAARGVFWTAIANWGNQLAIVLVFVVLSRLLDPDDFGLVALASVFVTLTQVVASQGMADALVQRPRLDAEHLDSGFWMSAGLACVLALVLAAASVPLAAALGQADLAPVLAVLALSIPIAGLSLVQRALLMRNLRFRSLAARTLAATGVGSVAGIGAALAGLGVWSLVVQNLSNQVAGAIVLWRVADWRPHFRFSRRHFHDLFGFGVHVVLFRLLNYVNRRADDFLVGAVLGPVALGFYSVAYRLLTLLIDVTTGLIDSVAFPVFSRLQEEPERLRRVYYKSSSFAALFAFPAFVAMLVMAPQLVDVVFGDKWSPSAPVMQVLAVFGLLQAIVYLNTTMIKALGKPSWRVWMVGATAVLNVAGFYIAVREGIVAVAVALVAVAYLLAPVSFWALNRLLPISLRAYGRQVVHPLVAALLMAMAMLGLRATVSGSRPVLVLLSVTTVGFVVYVGSLWVFARPLVAEAVELASQALPRWRKQKRSAVRRVASSAGAAGEPAHDGRGYLTRSRRHDAAKRALDLALVALALPIAILFGLFAALAIKLESRGPVFFRQERIGRRRQPFLIWKFRKMPVDLPEQGPLLTLRNDSRMLRVGRVLERTKLDELPQLINVLRGQMSMVGPRPEVAKFVAFYPERWDAVLSVKPGIFGTSQNSSRSESELYRGHESECEHFYVENVLPRKLDLDARYVTDATIASDLRLVLEGVGGSLSGLVRKAPKQVMSRA